MTHMPERLSEAELDDILQKCISTFDLGRNIAIEKNVTGNEAVKIAAQAIDRLNALIGAGQLSKEYVEKAVAAERSEIFCTAHARHWDNRGLCPVCEAIAAEQAIKAMTEGEEPQVQAIIAMVVGFLDHPPAMILLRHVAAQGERLQRAKAGLERLEHAESLLKTALDVMEHGFVWRNAKGAADSICTGIKSFLEKETPLLSSPEPSNNPGSEVLSGSTGA